MRQKFPGIKAFTGNENYLNDCLTIGGAGCISATFNLSIALAARLFSKSDFVKRDYIQTQFSHLREVIERYPIIAAIKQAVCTLYKNDTWKWVRPPHTLLNAKQAEQLKHDSGTVGFPDILTTSN